MTCRPRLLDLYCCAGGAGMGYRQAGLDVVGVDIEPQPHYPFEFHQGDAIEFLLAHGHEFDAIHASPPCQAWSPLNAYNHKVYPELIGPTREALKVVDRPYVIENVEAAASELVTPIMLCGPMYGLRVYRHRLFETSFLIAAPTHRPHVAVCSRNGYLPTDGKPFMTITGGKHSKAWREKAAEVMGVPWARTIREVCEAVPPAYTEFVGQQLMARVVCGIKAVAS